LVKDRAHFTTLSTQIGGIVKCLLKAKTIVTNQKFVVSYIQIRNHNLNYNIMKTLKSIVLGLALLVVCGVAKANTIDEKTTPNYAINTFVDAMTRGKLAGLDNVLDKSAEFNMLRGKTVMSFTKSQMLEFFKSNKTLSKPVPPAHRLLKAPTALPL